MTTNLIFKLFTLCVMRLYFCLLSLYVLYVTPLFKKFYQVLMSEVGTVMVDIY